MKNIIHSSLFLLALCLTQLLQAQNAPGIAWEIPLGGDSTERAFAVHQTADGGYIVAGSSKSNNGDVSGNHGGLDDWIVKLDAFGGLQWQNSLGGSGDDEALSLQLTSDGGYIVAGYSQSNNGDVSGHHGNLSLSDCWIVKLDANGTIQWQKSFGGNDEERASCIQQTSDGGYIVSGFTLSSDGDVSGHIGGYDYWVFKLDGSGGLLWQKCLGGSQDEQAYSVWQTTDGGFILAGFTLSSDSDVIGSHGGYDYWIVKMDGTGNIEWKKCLGGIDDDKAFSIQQTSDGGFIVAGISQSSNGDVSLNQGTWDYWIVKLNSLGTIDWQKSYGGGSIDIALSVQQISDGGFIVAGYSSSIGGDVSVLHGGYDYWIVDLDTAGILKWQKCFGGALDDKGYAIQQTTDGGFIVAGNSLSSTGDVSGNAGEEDIWVVRLASVTGIEESTGTNTAISVFPNPGDGNFTIKETTQVEESIPLKVFDETGRVVYAGQNVKAGNSSFQQLDLSYLSKGTYFMKVIHNGECEMKKLVIGK